ncbi:phosphoribosylformylglycinamidine synthase [Methanococcus voltae]|uniref:Phosphoribosylformylglycinamidine synthase subunit PurS n=2 Tax=Methanococcus voltae TaxID=2188 RepID=A0A8J7RLM8_METVO|nr:phosphoribosylformylglycinamidine synthase subunit PurS [Methanococcus voltae]MBP2144175.1 phosphoribosylformylglycinamidine synthase [Methanococcus voltae]MBP2171949.1 phosphoribosylformylglycinamidine synthase [Methanococcus voltae]MBP2201096.1 phosphoribosylformylglycinamidine synthase [Methanococcus voltae]MCS3921819.1 phosphoribosylformylglycinamidine synthase [Methanococcus voltae PS]
MYKAEITVKLKKGVLNPEGQTILKALNFLGFNEVSDVKSFKSIELEFEAENEEKAMERLTEMCNKLLANPVIHDYEIKLEKN